MSEKKSPQVDVSKLTDLEITLLVIERDVSQYKAERIDEVLNKIGEARGYSEATKEGKPSDADNPEVHEKLNWEKRDSEKGPFEMLRKDNCNDTQLFNHLENILKANKGNATMGDWHYWAGDTGFIFRRKKKRST